MGAPAQPVTGRRALLAVLQRTTLEYVAARCGVSRRTVGRWASGIRTPDPVRRAALQRNYGIAPESWGPV